MKTITCPCCRTEVPLKENTGIWVNQTLALGSRIASLQDQLARIPNVKHLSMARSILEKQIHDSQEKLRALEALRDESFAKTVSTAV